MTVIGRYFSYFEFSSNNIPTSRILIFLCFFIEYYPIAILNFLSISQIRIFFKESTFKIEDNIFFKISLLKYILPMISINDPTRTPVQLIITLCIILLLIILFICSWIFQDESLTRHLALLNKNKKNSNSLHILSSLRNIYHCILVWFYDIFFFRLLTFWIMFALVNSSFVMDNLTHASITEIIFRILILIFYTLILSLYFLYTFAYIKYEPSHNSYPFDEFSSKFEFIMLINKLLIALQYNAFLFNKESVLWLWSVCINSSSLALFLILMIYRLVKDSSYVIFYRNGEINIVRVFYLIFYIINLLLQLIFHIEHNIGFIIVYYICTISISIVLTMNVYNKQLAKVIEGTDSLMKILYIIDLYTTERQHELRDFTKKLSISHMNRCSEDFVKCKICTIFKHIFVNNNTNNNNINKQSNNSNNGNENDIKINVLELVDGLFTVKKHLLDETSSTFMIVSSFILLNTSKSNTFLLNLFYSKKIYFFLKNFPILAVNLMTYFKTILSCDSSSLAQVHTIIEQEENKKQMKNFLELFKEILCGIEEKPEFIVDAAIRMNNIQKMMKRNLISKYENSYDYHIIILKYMYEKILNRKIKSKGGSIFSFQLYDDLLQEHYSSDKFFLLSYDMPMKTFEIIRTSREYCNYTSHSFDSLFPFKNISKTYLEKLMSAVKENNLLKTTTNSFDKKPRVLRTTITPHTKANNVSSVNKNSKEHSHQNTSNSINNNNTNIFEFPIQDPEHSEYICSFKMNFKIFPTTDLKVFLAICFYQNQYSNTLITVYDKLIKEEKVVSFSLFLKDYFLVSPNILNFLSKYNRNILFNDLFRLSNTNLKIEKGSIFETNYKKYLPIINSDLQFYFDSETSINEDEKNNMLNVIKKEKKCEGEKKKPKTLEFISINEFDSKSNKNVLLRVYYFKNKSRSRKNSRLEREKSSDEDEMNLSINHNNFFNTYVEKKTDYKVVYNSSSSIMTNGSSVEKATTLQSNYDVLRQQFNGDKTKIEQTNKLSFFTYAILIYNLLLIAITVVFLVLELNKNKVFQNTFSFYQSWNRFCRLFMHSTLSSFALLCPAKDNANICENIYTKYSDELKVKTLINDKFDLMVYIQEELKIKVKSYQENLSQIKSNIYETKQRNLIDFGKGEILSYSFSDANGQYKMITSNVSLFDGLSIFLNYLNTIATDPTFKYIPMQIISKNDDGSANLENLIVTDNQPSKLDAYSVLVNYRILLQTIEEMSGIVTNNLLNDISDCKFIGNFLSIFLIVNHVGVLCICICCVILFKNILKQHCISITEKLNQQVIIDALREKVNILSKFILFYKENPNALHDNYELLKTKTKFQLKSNDKDANDNSPTSSLKGGNDNNNNNSAHEDSIDKKSTFSVSVNQAMLPSSSSLSMNSSNSNNNRNHNYIFNNVYNNNSFVSTKRLFDKADFFPVLKSSINVIFIVFLLYFIFSIVYLLLLITTLDDYSNLVQTFSYNSNLDLLIFSTATVFKVMLFTNQTDIELQSFYSDANHKIGYIENTLRESYRFLSLIEVAENSQDRRLVPLKESMDLSCDTMYPKFDDYLYNSLFDWHYNYTGGADLHEVLGKIFCSFPFSSYKDDKIWIKELIYRAIKVNGRIEHSFEALYNVTVSYEMFEFDLLTLLYFRPVRNFEATKAFLGSVNKLTKKYNVVVYSYLIINTCCEIILFFVLKKFVIEKYTFMNQSLDMMSVCMNV